MKILSIAVIQVIDNSINWTDSTFLNSTGGTTWSHVGWWTALHSWLAGNLEFRMSTEIEQLSSRRRVLDIDYNLHKIIRRQHADEFVRVRRREEEQPTKFTRQVFVFSLHCAVPIKATNRCSCISFSRLLAPFSTFSLSLLKLHTM